ncbi:sce7726 family protein [Pedobacter sp. GSP4]|uniref:sce7726 family protein n=1 Tax=Pedobacter sp. GSP4 TaxID=3453716 RepID=UPI003EE8FFFA
MNIAEDISVNSKLIKEIVKSYNPLDYTPQLRHLLSAFYPEDILGNICRPDLHKKISELIIDGYEGEQVLKYRLFDAFKNTDLVAAYEIRVKKSRVDFLTINGYTTSYEIKSNLDNLDKLAKQSRDYLDAFEFNNILIHQRHLDKCYDIIPKSFGIITAGKDHYSFVRKPVFNKKTDPVSQLSLLTKKEISKYFGQQEVSDILGYFTPADINTQFKLALKARYSRRWNFIVEHANEILPVDLQFFFNKNINPAIIYG